MTQQTFQFIATKVVQPIGDFFVAKIPYQIITRCASADIRRITDIAETMSGIQRDRTDRRVHEIYEYIRSIDSSFPNSVILNLKEEYSRLLGYKDIKFGKKNELIYIFEIDINKNTFDIIDGQHRLAGLGKIIEEKISINFDVITTFYRDLPIQEQAYLFSTINGKQNKINQSLVMDLFEESEYYTPEKCAHLVTKLLNRDENSPLNRRISMLGKAPKYNNDLLYKTVLSQGTVARRITKMISRNTVADREAIIQNKTIHVTEDDIFRGQIFREFYQRKEDWAIYKVLENFFKAVENSFTEEWKVQNSPLSKTIGFNALMSFLIILFKIGYKRKELTYKFFNEILTETRNNYVIDINKNEDNKLNFRNFQASGIGEKKLYKKFIEWSNLEIN